MRRVARILCALAVAGAVTPHVIAGQEPVERGSELTVYLMTMGPGQLIYERFGHNAIWIRDHARGTDWAYDYGIFDFDQPYFVARFALGRMLYSMGARPAEWMMAAYQHLGRSVWVQELELTPTQRHELREFLDWNALPENRDYRYDYYYDNCSNRVRDALDMALGGALRQATVGLPSGTTLRWHTARLTAPDPVMYTLIQAGLGRPTDREIDVWDELFIPMRLQEVVRDITVPDGNGGERPLVRAEQTVYISPIFIEPDAPPRWLGRFLLAGVLLGLLVAAAAFAGRTRRAGRAAFAVLSATWGVVGGAVGTILVFLWFFTDHAATYRNETVLQLNPLLLAVAVLVPALVMGRGWGARWAWRAVVAGLALSLLGLLLKAVPGSQVNGEFIAFALPVHTALAWGVYLLRPAAVTTRDVSPAVARGPRPMPSRSV